MLEQKTPRREQRLLFARNFLKHPKMLGSVIPSSNFLIKKLIQQIDVRRAKVIVEYGPGVGTITAALLQHMPADGTLIVLETNSDFVEFLRRHFNDPRLHVLHRSAADVETVLREHGFDYADYIISGIPFSTMPDALRVSILRATEAALRPDGQFLVYQFSGKVLPYLKQLFGHVEEGFELLNIPPARLYFCSPVRSRAVAGTR